jgi:hypothetical protein
MVETIGAGVASEQDVQELRNLFQTELPVGVDGSQAISAVNRIISDTTLHDNLYNLSQIAGDSADAREAVYQWVKDNRPDLVDRLDYYPTTQAKPQAQPSAQPTESVDFIRYLAGLKR